MPFLYLTGNQKINPRCAVRNRTERASSGTTANALALEAECPDKLPRPAKVFPQMDALGHKRKWLEIRPELGLQAFRNRGIDLILHRDVKIPFLLILRREAALIMGLQSPVQRSQRRRNTLEGRAAAQRHNLIDLYFKHGLIRSHHLHRVINPRLIRQSIEQCHVGIQIVSLLRKMPLSQVIEIRLCSRGNG